jgi:hypothetical protein
MLLLALIGIAPTPSIETLDALLSKRDVFGLSRWVAGEKRSYLGVIKTNGAYDVGRYGWKALDLNAVDGSRYVVFSTRLTSEDIGELLFKRAGNKLEYVPETDRMGIQVMRHSLRLKFDIPRKRAYISDRLSLRNETRKAGQFIFRMSPNYQVASITWGSKPVKFAQAGGVVSVVRPSDKADLTIQYSATVDQPRYAGSISEKEATLTNDYWYPMVARQPVPYDIEVVSPEGWVAVCQGVPVGAPTTSPGRTVTRFKMDLPCVYYSVSSAPYRLSEQKLGKMTFRTWSTRLDAAQEQLQNQVNADVVDYYGKSFGGWPFSTWGSLDSEFYGGGALEAYSFATYGTGMLPGIDAHEPAHTFWGGVLNNTYLKSFWNESFAVFSDGLYHRNGPVGNTADKRRAFVSDSSVDDDYKEVPVARGGAFAGPVASSLGYGKGAKVLQMLEQYLGTDLMVECMKRWAKEDAGRDVTWEDFETVVNRLAPEKKLGSFFDDWLRKPGYAELLITDVAKVGNQVSFKVGFKNFQYRMPLEVLVTLADGTRVYKTLDITGAGTYKVSVDGQPTGLSIDPWAKALRTRDRSEVVPSIENQMRRFKRYVDPAHIDYLQSRGRGNGPLPEGSLDGIYIIGHPDTTPRMKELCRLAQFKVEGSRLTYRGTTIDLDRGGAIALVDLPNGGKAMIGLGKTRLAPDAGNAKVAVFDEYGRFLRGETDPKTAGSLTFKLG